MEAFTFAYSGTHFQNRTLPFGLKLVPRVLTKVLVALIVHLRTKEAAIFPSPDDLLIRPLSLPPSGTEGWAINSLQPPGSWLHHQYEKEPTTSPVSSAPGGGDRFSPGKCVPVTGKAGKDHGLDKEDLTGVLCGCYIAGEGPQDDGLLPGYSAIISIPSTSSPKIPPPLSGVDDQEVTQDSSALDALD